jgi:glycerol-3-phosphate acyltransferase PlsY
MLLLTRIVHVLALGLWFGTAVFFTFVVGLSLFDTFEKLSLQKSRPYWFAMPAELEKAPPSDRFPDPLRKEQGSRVAGAAVGPMFPWYFGVQAACGILTLLTAFVFLRRRGKVHRLRLVLVLLAVVAVGVGWWMESVVEELRITRANTSDAVLQTPSPSSEQLEQANLCRANFARWHGYSLMLNLGTVALVTVAMALAAVLPQPLTVKQGT